jgi:Domain of unknown function (DUF6249)
MLFAKFIYSLLLISLLSSAVHAEELVGTPIDLNSPTSELAEQTQTVQESMAEDMREEKKSNKNILKVNDKVIKDWEDFGKNFHPFDNHTGNIAGGVMAGVVISIIAIIFSIGGPLILIGFIVFLVLRSRARRREQINHNIDKLIAAGRDVPLELLLANGAHHSVDSTITKTDNTLLNKGITNIGWGLGFLIFLTILCGFEVGAVAFIPIVLGISRIVIWGIANNFNWRSAQQHSASNITPASNSTPRIEN